MNKYLLLYLLFFILIPQSGADVISNDIKISNESEFNECTPPPPLPEVDFEFKKIHLAIANKECSDETVKIEQQFTNEIENLKTSSLTKAEKIARKKDLSRKHRLNLRQHEINCKLNSAKALHGEEYLANKIVPGIHLKTYSIKIFTHCALSAKNENNNTMQIELIPSGFENIGQYKTSTKISILGFIKPGIADIYKFPDEKIRKAMSPGEWEDDVSNPVCSKDPKQQSGQYYNNCIESQLARYSDSMSDPSKKSISYDPLLNNCCHFVEKIMNACGLVSCFGFPHSAGLDLGFKKGAVKNK